MNEYEYDAIVIYTAASDKGRKEARKARQEGRSIHPPAFETLFTPDASDTVRQLGMYDISIDNIVGPLTMARANAFSPGFLPVLEEHTEFALKWIQVCAHQMKDGISDPIKVIEYMGLYYIEEGNKRVSVMKWLGGESIRANVTRRVPVFDPSDPTSRLHRAMLGFEAKSHVREVRMSTESAYARLLDHVLNGAPVIGISPANSDTTGTSHMNTNKDGELFASSFRAPFLRLLRLLAGDKLLVLPDDALLMYLDAFPLWLPPFEAPLVEQRMKKFLPDWCTPSSTDDIQRPPAPLHPSRAITRKVKPEHNLIGILHLEDAKGSSWTAAHQAGLVQAREHLPSGTLREIILPANTRSLDAVMQSPDLAEVRTILCTAPALFDAVMKSAVDQEDRHFHICSPLPATTRMSTFFGCPHEPLFLMGILATTRTATGKIGWLGDTTIHHSAASLNAFTLGVRTLRPDAQIYPMEFIADSVETWTQFACNDIDLVLTSPVDDFTGSSPTDLRPFALLCPDMDAPCTAAESLASVVWDWGTFYEGFLPFLLLDGSKFNTTHNNGTRFNSTPFNGMNFSGARNNRQRKPTWRGGLATGLPDLHWLPDIFPPETARLVSHLRQALQTETFHPFSGPLKDKEGTLRVISGRTLSTQEILDMDWLVEGIIV